MKRYEWCDLIEFFEKEHYIHNGLTIPFLIGAMEKLQNRKLTISQLTDEILDQNNPKRPTIMKCDNIGELVIGILDNESLNYYKAYPKNVIKSLDNLSATDSSLDGFKDKMELTAHFEKLYKTKIDDETYSKNAGEWTNFIPKDLERIENYKKAVANRVDDSEPK